MENSFLFCTFCSAMTYMDVNFEYMPETFATCLEQRNNSAFGEEKEKYS